MQGRSLLDLATEGDDAALEIPPFFVSETRYQGTKKIAVHTPEWTYVENRDGHAGLNPRELQRRDGQENGRLPDRIDDEPAVAHRLKVFLDGWERRYPERPATQPLEDLSPEEVDQLRALGYVD